MRRHSKDKIKATGETKIRLRCSECGKFESHYYDEEPKFQMMRLGMGRPAYVEQR
mgnify:FL=1